MIRKPISIQTDFSLRIASIICVIMCYSWLSWRQHNINPKDTTIPNAYQFVQGWGKILKPSLTNQNFVTAATSTWFYKDVTASGIRLGLALIVGVILSFAVGLLMGVFPPVEAFCKWPILALGSVPPTAMLAVYFVIFGTEIKMYIAMIALGIFPSLSIAIYNASLSDVTDHAIYKAYTLGASTFEVIFEVVVQQILPRIIDSVRLMIGPAMVFLIAAEWNSADTGFGYRLRIQGRLLEMSVVYNYLIILGLSGFLIDCGLVKLRQKLCPWFDIRN